MVASEYLNTQNIKIAAKNYKMYYKKIYHLKKTEAQKSFPTGLTYSVCINPECLVVLPMNSIAKKHTFQSNHDGFVQLHFQSNWYCSNKEACSIRK